MQILVGLAQVSSEVLLEISNKERQSSALSAGDNSNSSKDKIKRLTDELDKLGETKTQLESEMQHLFHSFFVHRHRDVNTDIR